MDDDELIDEDDLVSATVSYTAHLVVKADSR